MMTMAAFTGCCSNLLLLAAAVLCVTGPLHHYFVLVCSMSEFRFRIARGGVHDMMPANA